MAARQNSAELEENQRLRSVHSSLVLDNERLRRQLARQQSGGCEGGGGGLVGVTPEGAATRPRSPSR